MSNQTEWNPREIRPIKKQPWYSHYQCAKSRCDNPNNPSYENYGEKGIYFDLTPMEVHILWSRDKGEELRQASIDRRNPYDGYTFYNCRFIELSENVRRSSLGRKWTQEQREKIIKANTGKRRSEEFCEKMRQLNLGTTKPMSEETKIKISNKLKGIKRSQEFKDKIKKSWKGRKLCVSV